MSPAGTLRRIESFEPSPGVAYPMLAATVFLWAIGVVIVRAMANEGVPPIGLSWWRWAAGAVFLAPLAWPDLVRNWALIRRHLRLFVLLGALQVAGGTLLFIGVSFTTAINASLVNSTQPAVTALCAWLVLRHGLGGWQSFGIAAALAGVAIMVTRADLTVLLAMDFQAGDLIVILATFSYAFYAVLLQRIPRGIGLFTVVFLIAVMGTVVLLPVYVAETVIVGPVPFNGTMVAAVVVLAVFVSVMSIFMWNAGNRAVGPNRAGVFVNLLPAYGATLAIPFLGEQLFAYHFLGFAFVAGGILFVIRGHR